MQSALFLSYFNLKWNISMKFGKNPSYEISQKLV